MDGTADSTRAAPSASFLKWTLSHSRCLTHFSQGKRLKPPWESPIFVYISLKRMYNLFQFKISFSSKIPRFSRKILKIRLLNQSTHTCFLPIRQNYPDSKRRFAHVNTGTGHRNRAESARRASQTREARPILPILSGSWNGWVRKRQKWRPCFTTWWKIPQ